MRLCPHILLNGPRCEPGEQFRKNVMSKLFRNVPLVDSLEMSPLRWFTVPPPPEEGEL
jgi:hypothetical protein